MGFLGYKQKSAIHKAISLIQSECPDAEIRFDGMAIDSPNDFSRMLELTSDADEATVRLIIAQLESIADVLRHQMENGSPNPVRLLYLRVDTSDQSPSYVDFEWKRGK